MPPSPAVVCPPDAQIPGFFIPVASGTDMELAPIQVVTTENNTAGDFWRLVIEPNCSLTWRQSMAFFVGISVLLLSIATVFAVKGYWMIFPFAGLELVALGAGLYVAAHANSRRQVVSITEDLVTVEKGKLRHGPQSRMELPRCWTRVEYECADEQRHPNRLWLGASGRRVEVGEFLAEGEKNGLASHLRRLIQNSDHGGVRICPDRNKLPNG